MCWLTDKHSVSMLIADISLLGVRLPRHRYHHCSAALKSLRAGATGVTGRGRTKRTLVWSVGKKQKEKIMVRAGHFFSLRVQNAHISSSSRPLSLVPHPKFSALTM